MSGQQEKGRYAFACAAYGPIILDCLKRDSTAADFLAKTQKGQPNHDMQAVFRAFAATDPTATHKGSQYKYLNWLCRAYINSQHGNKRISYEDLYKLGDDLREYHQLCSQPAFKVNYGGKGIEQFTSHTTLADAVKPFVTKRLARAEARNERHMSPAARDKINQETIWIYKGPEGSILIPCTMETMIYWGQNTRWCVAANQSRNAFKDYNKTAPLVVYLPKGRNIDDNNRKFCGRRDVIFNPEDKILRAVPDALMPLLAAAQRALPPAHYEWLKQHGGLNAQETPEQGVQNPLYAQALKRPEIFDSNPALLRDEDFLTCCAREKEFSTDYEDGRNNYIFSRLPADLQESVPLFTRLCAHNPDLLDFAGNSPRQSKDLALLAVGKDRYAVQYFCAALRNDADVFDTALNCAADDDRITSLLKDAGPAIRAHPDIVRKAAKRFVYDLQYADPALLNDGVYMRDLVADIPKAYAFAPESVRADAALALQAVRKGVFYKIDIPNGKNITNPGSHSVYSYAPPHMRHNDEFALECASHFGMSLRDMTSQQRATPHIVLAAIKENEDAWDFVDRDLQRDSGFMQNAIDANPRILGKLKHKFPDYRERAKDIIRRNTNHFAYFDKIFEKDSEFILDIARATTTFGLSWKSGEKHNTVASLLESTMSSLCEGQGYTDSDSAKKNEIRADFAFRIMEVNIRFIYAFTSSFYQTTILDIPQEKRELLASRMLQSATDIPVRDMVDIFERLDVPLPLRAQRRFIAEIIGAPKETEDFGGTFHKFSALWGHAGPIADPRRALQIIDTAIARESVPRPPQPDAPAL
jgi:hypothetical protein